MNAMEKKRCNNFSKDEIEILVGFVEKHKEVVECKKTDSVTSNAKDAEWRKIETEFNAACGTGRTAKMLRSKWDSLKKSTKKEFAEYKQKLYRTGGGPTVQLNLNVISERVLAIIGVGATGTLSQYDSDFVLVEPTLVEPEGIILNETPAEYNRSNSGICIETAVDASTEIQVMELPSCSWNSWNPQQLRKPKSQQLQVPSIKSPITGDNIQQHSPLTLRKLDTDIPMANNNGEKLQTPKSNTFATKKKRMYKTESTSSQLQKQRSGTVYEELARKKMEYIDFQMNLLKEEAERKENRLAEKHKLEIKILLADLKNKESSQ